MAADPQVTRCSLMDMQVCVPSDWTDEQAEEFANIARPTGISSRWCMKHTGDKYLGGDPERVQCHERDGYIHIALSC